MNYLSTGEKKLLLFLITVLALGLTVKITHNQLQIIPASGLALADSRSTRQLIDINSASASLMAELPGIGPVISQRIAEYRLKNGPFKTKQGLLKVNGIGVKKLQKIEPLITIG